MLESFREVRDEIEQKVLTWIDNPEAELAKLREERERQRRERVEAEQREAERRAGQEFRNEVLSAGLDLDPGESGYTPSPRRRPCAL